MKEDDNVKECGSTEGQKWTQGFAGVARPLALRPRSRLQYNIKMDVKDIGWVSVNGVDVVQKKDKRSRVANVTSNLRVL